MVRRWGRIANSKVDRLIRAEGLLRPARFPRPRLASARSFSVALPNRRRSTA
jgi:hypothetical protein